MLDPARRRLANAVAIRAVRNLPLGNAGAITRRQWIADLRSHARLLAEAIDALDHVGEVIAAAAMRYWPRGGRPGLHAIEPPVLRLRRTPPSAPQPFRPELFADASPARITPLPQATTVAPKPKAKPRRYAGSTIEPMHRSAAGHAFA